MRQLSAPSHRRPETVRKCMPCVIGGTSLSGGIGSLSGTIIGVFVISVLKAGLLSMGLPVQWQNVLIGLVVLLAVLVDVIRMKKIKK